MAHFTDYLEQKVLEYVFRGQPFAQPSALYVGLFTVLPTSDAGTGGTEVSGGGYQRMSLGTLSSAWTAWTAASGIRNAADISFPQATTAWGTVVGMGIWDAATGGNLLAFAAFTTGKPVNSGDVLIIKANDITINFVD
jgi:hypothetical protein